jgi:2-polyprenyl-3-methyl-5-hydroxy-6-metoxy-1,4-benzoquinol methylase
MMATIKQVAMDNARPGASSGVLSCPACGSLGALCVRTRGNELFEVYECKACSLRFSDPMKAGDADWYASSTIYSYRRLWLPSVDPRGILSWPIYWNFREALSILRTVPLESKPRLLDVGCGEGQFLYLARQLGFEVAGLDFNSLSLEAARSAFGITSLYQDSLEHFAASHRGELYDVITMFEVLEHTANPFETIVNVSSLLKPGGILLMSVPGYRRWPPLFDRETDNPPHHLTLWTEQALSRILERASLENISVRRKHLDAGDLGCYAKLRFKEFFEAAFRFPQVRSETEQCPDSSGDSLIGSRITLGLLRLLGWIALTPLCWAFMLNPRAGGFRLFTRSRKPT